MARLLWIQFTGAIYHVTARGNERRFIFKGDMDRRRFLKNLAEAQQFHSARLYEVCLMPNHFHLVVETPGGNLSALMARLLTAYAVYDNRRHQRVGHLTQGRYKAQLVEGNDYLLKLSRYIHLNPVYGKAWEGVPVAERRDHLRACRWSTFPSYAGLRATRRVQRPEDVAFRRVGAGRSVQGVLAVVVAVFATPQSALRQRSCNSAARGAAAWALVRHAGLTERAAAEVLCMGTGAAVSQQLAKWRRAVLTEPRLLAMEPLLEQKLAAANF